MPRTSCPCGREVAEHLHPLGASVKVLYSRADQFVGGDGAADVGIAAFLRRENMARSLQRGQASTPVCRCASRFASTSVSLPSACGMRRPKFIVRCACASTSPPGNSHAPGRGAASGTGTSVRQPSRIHQSRGSPPTGSADACTCHGPADEPVSDASRWLMRRSIPESLAPRRSTRRWTPRPSCRERPAHNAIEGDRSPGPSGGGPHDSPGLIVTRLSWGPAFVGSGFSRTLPSSVRVCLSCPLWLCAQPALSHTMRNAWCGATVTACVYARRRTTSRKGRCV